MRVITRMECSVIREAIDPDFSAPCAGVRQRDDRMKMAACAEQSETRGTTVPDLKRRNFIMLLGRCAAVWPFAARAQQNVLPIVGWLSASSEEGSANRLTAFREGLKQAGFIEHQNVAIEYRWAGGASDRLPRFAAELVRRGVAAIAAIGGSPAAVAAKAVTATIPIVFANGSDPVASGLVASLNQPGENITGVSFFNAALAAKRLELLHELAPTSTAIAFLVNPNNPIGILELEQTIAAAGKLGIRLRILDSTNDHEFDMHLAALVNSPPDAVLVATDPLLTAHRRQLTAAMARQRIPAIYPDRAFAVAGGLISYASSDSEACRQGGGYVGRILKGEKPANLPVMLPTRFDLVINLQTAKAIGIAVPMTLRALATEVIE
jgi:putative tryptophan/tyrosine transport system substrate-binding protein